MSQSVEVQVPDIGDFSDVEVIEILVKPGDTVAADQSLITVETDKASMEIPSSVAGVVRELRVTLGDKVSKGRVIALVDVDDAVVAASSPPPSGSSSIAAAQPVAAVASVVAPPSAGTAERLPPVAAEPGDDSRAVKPHASPSVRRFARELGVDLSQVQGTGPKQRIVQGDVQAYLKALVARASAPAGPAGPAAGEMALGLIAWPKVDFASHGPIERQARSRIKKLSAANLHRNWVMIPHVTNHDEADITELEAFRVRLNDEQGKDGTKVTMLAFLIKACVTVLKRFPDFNASLEADELVLKNYWHIGFAADTPNGLVVPVVRDADRKGILQIARETAALAAKAREGKLAPADMQGGTFSISSLGGIGGTGFTPIINAPEVAILGVCRAQTRPAWNGSTFEPRLMLPLSLSWDHRVVDGASAARFNVALAQLLADFRRVAL